MSDPSESHYFPEWPYWLKWTGLLGLLFLIGLLQKSVVFWILGFCLLGPLLKIGWPFRRGWWIDAEGVQEVRLTGRRVSHPWETLLSLEEDPPHWTYLSRPVLRLETPSGPLRWGTFMQPWEDFVARLRAGLTRSAAPAPKARPPTAEEIAQAFGVTVEELPLTFGFGRQSRPIGCLSLALFWMFPVWFLIGWAQVSLRRQKVEVGAQGITVAEQHRTYPWADVLQVGLTEDLWRYRYVWVRFPWRQLAFAALREPDRLYAGLRQLIEAREAPPSYPVGVPEAPETALSRAAPPARPEPTDAALSRSQPEAPPRLTESVEQTESEGQRIVGGP